MVKEMDIVNEIKTKKAANIMRFVRIACLLLATLCMIGWLYTGVFYGLVTGGLLYYCTMMAFIEERYLITKGLIRGWW